MLLRYANLSHCRRHRHVASTLTMVLEGEQHLTEWQSDGSKKSIIRKKGDYAIASADALPHDERGGENGGTVLLSGAAAIGTGLAGAVSAVPIAVGLVVAGASTMYAGEVYKKYRGTIEVQECLLESGYTIVILESDD